MTKYSTLRCSLVVTNRHLRIFLGQGLREFRLSEKKLQNKIINPQHI